MISPSFITILFHNVSRSLYLILFPIFSIDEIRRIFAGIGDLVESCLFTQAEHPSANTPHTNQDPEHSQFDTPLSLRYTDTLPFSKAIPEIVKAT